MNDISRLSLIATASYFPEKVVTNDFFPGLNDSNHKMFQGTKTRHHITQEMSSVDMFVKACEKINTEGVDAILTNMALPDLPFTGSGAILAQRLNLKPRVVLDLHNGGCVAFITLMDFAQGLMKSHNVKRVLICVSQSTAGKVFSDNDVRKKAQAAIPGDGAGVAIFSNEEGPNYLESILVKCHPEFASDMNIECADNRKWWQPGKSQFSINFDENKITSIIMRGNRLVPAVMKELLDQSGLKSSAIGGLITNQPNTHFLRNWRESLQIQEDRHFHSFSEHGNLFQAGIPVNLDRALRNNLIRKESRVMLAGFSHAGDYSAAAILRFH